MAYNVVGIGEILWDLLPSGPQLGGAPANFAYHAHALGGNAQVISRVGRDQLGRDIFDRIGAMGLSSTGLQTDETAPTGTVTVELDDKGVPAYTIHENTAWDRIAAAAESLSLAGAADAVCFGSLAQRSPVSRETIQRLVSATPAKAWRVFDINLRQHFYSRETIERSLQLASVLKLNDGELPVLADMFALAGDSARQLESLAKTFGLQVVALTRGADGSLLYRDGDWSDCKPEPVDVVDTVGAGDAFTAALVLGLLHGETLEEMHEFASEVAGYVCTRAGATPALPERLSLYYSK